MFPTKFYYVIYLIVWLIKYLVEHLVLTSLKNIKCNFHYNFRYWHIFKWYIGCKKWDTICFKVVKLWWNSKSNIFECMFCKVFGASHGGSFWSFILHTCWYMALFGSCLLKYDCSWIYLWILQVDVVHYSNVCVHHKLNVSWGANKRWQMELIFDKGTKFDVVTIMHLLQVSQATSWTNNGQIGIY